jgi:cytoplasmic iron level regulating protein YaaA (DUF328/UPF0246 family)
MLFVLSPAKTLDFDTPSPVKRPTTPGFLDRSAELIGILKTRRTADIQQLMDLSEPLARLNVERYAAWSPKATARNSRPAVLAFNGDVYEGLAAKTLSTAELAWAQRHVLILSGLYGALRPLDRLQPYRLEMGTPLATPRGANLYDFWSDTLAEYLNQRLADEKAPVVVNLASQEYFRAAGRPSLVPRVVECVFEDWKTDRYKVISFFAKRARGLMARHAIVHRIATVSGLKRFDAEGYAFAAEASTRDRLVFRRRAA